MLDSSAYDTRVDVVAGYRGEVRAKPVWYDAELEGGFFGFPDWVERLWFYGGVGVVGMMRRGSRAGQADGDKGIRLSVAIFGSQILSREHLYAESA